MTLPHGPRPRFLGPWAWFFVLLAALGGLVLWLASGSGRLPDDHAGGARLVQGVVLAALIGAGIVHGRRMGLKSTLGAAFIWLALGAGLVLAYSFRFEAERAWNRIAVELVPDRIRAAQGAIRVRRSDDGHFYMRAMVNHVEVRFLVDTGATTTVLDPRDAVRVGLDPRKLSFNESFRTANGMVRGARVSLARVAFGPVEFRDVRASVNGAPLGTSLLGISTLERFRAWRVEDGTLSLEY
jgi:aspartyl protease family protein